MVAPVDHLLAVLLLNVQIKALSYVLVFIGLECLILTLERALLRMQRQLSPSWHHSTLLWILITTVLVEGLFGGNGTRCSHFYRYIWFSLRIRLYMVNASALLRWWQFMIDLFFWINRRSLRLLLSLMRNGYFNSIDRFPTSIQNLKWLQMFEVIVEQFEVARSLILLIFHILIEHALQFLHIHLLVQSFKVGGVKTALRFII